MIRIYLYVAYCYIFSRWYKFIFLVSVMVIADLKDSADEKKISLLEIQFWKALLSGLIVEQFFQGRNKIFRKIGSGYQNFQQKFRSLGEIFPGKKFQWQSLKFFANFGEIYAQVSSYSFAYKSPFLKSEVIIQLQASSSLLELRVGSYGRLCGSWCITLTEWMY